MRILYYIPYDHDFADGVVKKINSQVTVWEKLGAQVLCLWHSNTTSENAEDWCVKYHRLKISVGDWDRVKDFAPDIVYFRYTSVNALLLRLLLNYRGVFEVNGIAHSERKPESLLQVSQVAIKLVHLLSLRMYKKVVAGCVSPTQELIEVLSLPNAAVFPNSIDITKYSRIKGTEKPYPGLNLFFMGTNSFSWHGIHYIERLAELLPEYRFHIVGSNGVEKENLQFHGYMTTEQYQELLTRVDICIGTMALHERGLKQAAALKVREYIAYGFPVLLNYIDQKEIMSKDWCLNIDVVSLESLEDKVEEIRDFCERQKHTVLNDLDRELVSSQTIEKHRIEFLEHIVVQKGR